MRKMTGHWSLVTGYWLLATACCLLLTGCGSAKRSPARDSAPGPGTQRVLALTVATPANSFPSAFNPPEFSPPAASPTGRLTLTFNGPVQGAPANVEPPTLQPPIIVGPDFATPNPALVSGRGNIDFFLEISGLPPPNNPAGGYDVDAPAVVDGVDIEAENPFYWSRTTPCPDDPPVADNRPFRCNTIRNGVLQLWLMARVPPAFTTTPPPVGQRQALTLFYRRRDDATGEAGTLRGFTGVAGPGAPPPGVQPDDIRVQLPGKHPLTGETLPGPIRVVGLPPFRPNADGTARVRVFALGERLMDAATTGGFEIAIAPRNVLTAPPGQPSTMLVLLRTVPAIEVLPVQHFINSEFGIALSLEPPNEEGTNLILRNPIDVYLFR